MKNLWTIDIESLVNLYVGCLDFEKLKPQKVLVKIKCNYVCKVAKNNITNLHLDDFINYDILYKEIQNLQNIPHIELLENYILLLKNNIIAALQNNQNNDKNNNLIAIKLLEISMQKIEIYNNAKVSICKKFFPRDL